MNKQEQEKRARDFGGGCPSTKTKTLPNGKVVEFRCMLQDGHLGTCTGNGLGKNRRMKASWLRRKS